MFYKIVLKCVHLCIDGLHVGRLVLRDLLLFIQHCVSLLLSYLQIHRPIKQTWLEKLPSHIGIVITEDQIHFSDLSNLIVWSFCVGIHHVSIYDSTGFIKSNGELLYKEATLRKNSLLKKQAHGLNIIFTDGKVPYSYSTIIKNGHKTEDVNVYLLSHLDGKQEIVEAAKALSRKAKQNPDILEKLHAQQFDCFLKVKDIPDPGLVILFGQTKGLMGYLPWHIRLTEIISRPTHHNFSLGEFHSVLSRYSKCEQRFGK